MAKLNWNNLKDFICPMCNGRLKQSILSPIYTCSTYGCDFTIRAEKFETIVNNRYKPKLASEPKDNFEELQNLGHERVTEDFSDSPYHEKE